RGARHHTETEGTREGLDPEIGQAQIDRVARPQVHAFQHRDIGRKTDGEGRQQEVNNDQKSELQARQEQRIGFHRHLPSRGRKALWPESKNPALSSPPGNVTATPALRASGMPRWSAIEMDV